MAQRRRVLGSRLAETAAHLFAALGDPHRVQLIYRLSTEGPASISQLSDGAKITRQAVTKHLKMLGKSGMVRNTQHGREVRWEVEPKGLGDAQHYLGLISEQWDQTIDRLQKFVED